MKVRLLQMTDAALAAVRTAVALLALLVPGASSCRNGADAPPSPVVWSVSRATLGVVGDDTWQGVPAVADGVAVLDVQGGIAALDVETGQVRWNARPWGGRRFSASANLPVRDGRVFVIDPVLSRVAALDLRDGHTLWDIAVDTLGAGGFVADVDAASLYIATRARVLVALDVATGTERWRRDFAASAGVLVGAATDGANVYVAGSRATGQCPFCLEEFTAAVAAASGVLLWQRLEGDSSSDAASAPTLAGELLVTAGIAHGILARSTRTGVTQWRNPGAARYAAMKSSPVVLGDTVLVGDGPTLFALRLADGVPLYTRDLQSTIRYIAPCDGRLLVSHQALDMVDLRTGKVLGRWLDQEYGGLGFITSGFGASGNHAVASTSSHIVGIRCR